MSPAMKIIFIGVCLLLVVSEVLGRGGQRNRRGGKKGKVCSCHKPCAEDSCCVGTLHSNTRKGRCQPLGKLNSTCLVSNEVREGMKEDYCQCGPGLTCVAEGSSDEGVCKARPCNGPKDCPPSGFCCAGDLPLKGKRQVQVTGTCTPLGESGDDCFETPRILNDVYHRYCECASNACISDQTLQEPPFGFLGKCQ